jgi:SAM-dependent methyltransferase
VDASPSPHVGAPAEVVTAPDGGGVAPDGSPVDVYLAVPAAPSFREVLDHLPAGASVLDLGCGVGRLANLLARRGHRVTGVDESPSMLRHLDPAVDAVERRIEGLDLPVRFDVVVLASHLVNVADADQRRSFLAAASRHVEASGRVFIEHHDPTTVGNGQERTGALGPVHVCFRVLARRGDEFDGQVVYRLGERSWTQTFTAVVLDAAGLEAALREVGLRTGRRISATWTEARPVSTASTVGP